MVRDGTRVRCSRLDFVDPKDLWKNKWREGYVRRRYVHPALPPRNSNPVLLQESTTSLFIVRTLAEKKKKVKMEERCEENAIGVEGDDLDTGIAN